MLNLKLYAVNSIKALKKNRIL